MERENHPLYGLFLKLAGRRAVVVGGGTVAARKVDGLLTCGASVQVIAPELIGSLAELLHTGEINWLSRAYQSGDLADAFVVIAATDSVAVNAQVAAEAELRGLLVNVVNDQEAGNFVVPAMIRRGPLQIGLTTGGASPAWAKKIREELEAQIGPEYGELLTRIALVRQTLLQTVADPEERAERLRALASSELFGLLQQGRRAEAERLIATIMGGNADEADCRGDT